MADSEREFGGDVQIEGREGADGEAGEGVSSSLG